MKPVAYAAATSFFATDTLVYLEHLTSRQLKLLLCTTDHRTTGYAGGVAISCIVNSVRRGCSVPLRTRVMAAANDRNICAFTTKL